MKSLKTNQNVLQGAVGILIIIFLFISNYGQAQRLVKEGTPPQTTQFFEYIVNGTSRLGIGTSQPDALLQIKNISDITSTPFLKLYSLSGTSPIGTLSFFYLYNGQKYGIYQTSTSHDMLNYFQDPVKIGRTLYGDWTDGNAAIVLENNSPNFTFYFPTNPIIDPVPTPLIIYRDKIKFLQLQMTKNAGLNKVMVSDANGNGNWTDISEYFPDYWRPNGNGDIYTTYRRVGIGTQNPTQKLEICHTDEKDGIALNQVSNDFNTTEIKFERKGIEKVSIGYTVTGDDRNAPAFFIWNNVKPELNFPLWIDLSNGMTGIGTNWPSAKLEVAGDFKATAVGIGINPPPSGDPYKLWVDGGIAAREVKVTIHDFPDYCFKDEYNLMPLPELKKYISLNKHLPEMPSAMDVENNQGIKLGEMQAKLLKKIEEQTLYILDLQKQIDELRNELIQKEDKQ